MNIRLSRFGRLIRSLAAGAGLAAAAGCSLAQGVVEVGATVPLTGPLSLTGRQYFNALKLAEDDINRDGGVQGKPLRFVFEDAQASNGTAVNAFVKLLQERKPPFVFLSSYSTQNIAVAPEVAKAGIPVMYAGGADAVSALNNPWMFRIRPQDSTAAVAMARFVQHQIKASRPGIVYLQNDFGQGGANAAARFLEEQGIRPVAMEAYGQNDKDMSAQLLSLKNKGADVILGFVYPQDGALLLRQIKALGLSQPVVASSAAFVPAAMQLLSPADLDKVWGVVDAWLESSQPARDFMARYKARFRVEADPYGAAYYDGAMLMAKAMNQVGTDPEKLRAYLAGVRDYQGISHRYRMDATGNGVHDVAVVRFKPGTKEMQFVESIPAR